MKYLIKAGSTDRTILIFVPDSSSTVGAGKAGLVAANLTANYARVETDNDVLEAAIAVSDLTALTDAHADGGWKEIDATNMKGWYRFDLPDAVLAVGAWFAGVNLQDAGGNDIAPVPMEIQLVAFDPDDAAGLGLSRVDAAVSTRASQSSVDTINDFLDTEIAAIKTVTDGLSAQLGLGTGARSVTVTVNDGAAAVEAARVRLIKGAENYVGSTNASGQLVFALDDGTWSVAVSRPGYSFTPTTLVVDGAETPTYSLTLVAIAASVPGKTTGYLTCYDERGIPESGVSVTIYPAKPTSSGSAFDRAERTETSTSAGLVQFSNLFKGERYTLKRGTGEGVTIAIPAGAGAAFELPSIIGLP